MKWEKERLQKEKKEKPSSTIDAEGVADLLITRKRAFAATAVMESLKK